MAPISSPASCGSESLISPLSPHMPSAQSPRHGAPWALVRCSSPGLPRRVAAGAEQTPFPTGLQRAEQPAQVGLAVPFARCATCHQCWLQTPCGFMNSPRNKLSALRLTLSLCGATRFPTEMCLQIRAKEPDEGKAVGSGWGEELSQRCQIIDRISLESQQHGQTTPLISKHPSPSPLLEGVTVKSKISKVPRMPREAKPAIAEAGTWSQEEARTRST